MNIIAHNQWNQYSEQFAFHTDIIPLIASDVAISCLYWYVGQLTGQRISDAVQGEM